MRWVGHVDMDAFFASVEQLTRPTLRGRAVLVGRAGPRGTVAAASYEARVFGTCSAMPMSAARRACPHAVVLPPRITLYRAVSEQAMGVLAGVCPGVVEQVSLDEAFLELSAAACIEAICGELRARVRAETGLACSVGVGSGKQAAKIASRLAKPDGSRVLTRGEERPLLHGLQVRALWGIGPVAEAALHRIGVRTIGQLATLDVTDVTDLLGEAAGRHLHALARGHDNRPVTPRPGAKQVSAETTFEHDLRPGPELEAALDKQARHAHARLAGDGRAARTVTVKLRTGDFATVSRAATLPTGTTDPAALLDLARWLLPAVLAAAGADDRGVRLLGVGYSGLTPPGPDELFPTPPARGHPTPVETSEAPPDTPRIFGAPTLPAPPAVERWAAGMDVHHANHGHGWVQGAGAGRVTVRFETRATGPGRARSFATTDPDLAPADPLQSLG